MNRRLCALVLSIIVLLFLSIFVSDHSVQGSERDSVPSFAPIAAEPSPTALPPNPDANSAINETITAVPASCTGSNSPFTCTIVAAATWQQTPLTLQAGAPFSILYMSGNWTVDYRSFSYVGPDGYAPDIDGQITPGCKVDSTSTYARLLGQIGNGPIFSVGSGLTFTANASGPLSLRINDQDSCLTDNDGSLVLKLQYGILYSLISGRVTNANGHPLPNITIATTDGDSTTTQADGSYSFGDQAPGAHTIIPSQSGYVFSPSERTVTVPPDATGVNFTGTAISFSCNNVTEIPSSECEGLVALYNSTNGPNWKNRDGWVTTLTPCSWFGVSCYNNHLFLLNLPNNNLIGTIPPQINKLATLSGLYLNNNQLSGSIPAEIGSLKVLDLYLSNNQLSGAIPSQIGNVTTLYHLYLDNNRLSGSIPTQIGNLSRIITLHLSGNQLSGNLPTQLGNLNTLVSLGLCCNQLNGTLPTGIGNLTKLTFLALDGNQFSGNLPTQLGSLVNLGELHLENNPSIGGSLPGSLTNLSKLATFWFHNTGLCEPSDSAFQTWLSRIANLNRTGVFCATRPSAEFDAWPQSGTAPLIVAMHIVNTANISNCTWEYGDGKTGNSCANYHDYIYTSAGTYTVKLTVSGPSGTDNMTRNNYIVVSAAPVNMPPVANSQSFIIRQDTYINITLTASDVDNDPLAYVIVSNPSHGILSGVPPTIRYTPANGFNGTDNFTFKANDGKADSNIAPVSITVAPVASCYTLTTAASPTNGGTVSIAPAPNCQGNKYTQGSTVSLSAISDPTYIFSHWSGAASGNANPLNIVMDANKNVTANFTQSVFSCNNVTEIPVTECESLVALYNTTGGSAWTNRSGWLVTLTPCSWYGVACSNQHVAALYLAGNRLGGNLPRQLGNLTNLDTLDLSSNFLSGSIPVELGSLVNLASIDLSANSLSGVIPSELSNLNNLTQLILGENQLSGAIPATLGNLTSLIELSLNDNGFDGNIPLELGNLAHLEIFDLYNNKLIGNIPLQLTKLTNLNDFSVGYNQLDGSIPTELGNLIKLTNLALNNNSFSGALPGSLTNLNQLNIFQFDHTSLCEPADTQFQMWLASLLSTNRTNVKCVIAEFTATPVSGNVPLIVSFHNDSIGDFTTCTWDYGDRVSKNSCASSHNYIYSMAGTYTVQLTVTGTGGTSSRTKTNYISVAPPQYSISGRITDGHDHPLIDMYVGLLDIVDGPTGITDTTDLNGNFLFSDVKPGKTYRIWAVIRDSNNRRQVRWGENITLVDAKTKPFYFDPSQTSIVKNIDFGDLTLDTILIPIEQLDDLAVTYHHTTEVKDFINEKLGLPNYKPVTFIWSYVPTDGVVSVGLGKARGASYNQGSAAPDDELIIIREDVSPWEGYLNRANRPMNREWHENFHHLMDVTIGIPDLSGGDSHGGINNSNSRGSWIEGWAEFWPCVLRDSLNIPSPWLYIWEDTVTSIEVNWQIWYTLHTVSREEFAVASLLWDFYDPKHSDDDDNIDLSLATLWSIIGSNKPNNSLNDMRDVYEAFLAAANQTTLTNEDGSLVTVEDINQVFIAHGFYADWNNNHYRDTNEEPGWAGIKNGKERRSTPTVPNAFLKLNIQNQDSKPLLNSSLVVEVHFDNNYYDYSYTVDLDSTRGMLYLELPPSRTVATAELTVIHDNGRSDPFIISNSTYWDKVANSTAGYAEEHTFIVTYQTYLPIVTKNP